MGRRLRQWAAMNNSKCPPRQTHPIINTRAGQRHRDPLLYTHPYDSMRRYAELLGVRHDSPRTRHTTGGGDASGEIPRMRDPQG